MPNKTALVTGAAKRVGLDTANNLAQSGYNIILHFNSSSAEAEKAKKQIEANHGVECNLIKSDLSVASEYSTIMTQAAEFTKDIDLIINNASIFPDVDFKDSSIELLEETFSVHVFAPYRILQDYSKLIGKGHVINIIDTNVSKNDLMRFPYLLSKKSLLNLTEMAALELAPNVRVNAICPTVVNGHYDNLNKSMSKTILEQIPMQQYTSTDKIFKSIMYLEETDHTGQIIYCDGGLNLI